MTKLRLAWIIAVVLLSVSAFSAKVDARRIRVIVPGFSTLIANTIAIEKGYYRQEGLEVDLIVARVRVGIQALMAGEVDFAGPVGPGLVAILRGAPLRIVFTPFDRPLHWLMVKPEIREVKALRGKKVALSSLGGTADFFLRHILQKRGLKGGRDVAFMGLGPNSIRMAALQSGAVDGAMVATPFNFRAKQAGFRELVSFLKQKDLVEFQGGLLTSQELIQSDPAIVEKFIRATLKGFLYARTIRSGTIPNMSRNLRVKHDLAAKAYDLIRPAMTADATVSEELQKQYLEFVLKIQGLKQSPPLQRIFDFSAVRKAGAELKAEGWKPKK